MAQVTPVQPKKKSRKPLIIGIILAVVMLVFAVYGTFVVIKLAPFIGVIGKSSQINSNYGDRVAAMRSASKQAGVGDSLQAGPFAIKVTAVEFNYQPDQRNMEYIESLRSKDTRSRQKDTAEYNAKRYAWNTDAVQYVLVYSEVTYDLEGENKGTVYPVFTNDEADIIASAAIGENRPVIRWVGEQSDPGRNFLSDENVKALKEGQPIKVTYLFRVPTSASADTLSYKAQFFSKVSNIVGTEGMPRDELTYNFTLKK